MSENPNQPGEYDAVLGGQAPNPVDGAVLGGIEGVKSRLASAVVEARVAALKEALKYGDAGLDLVIGAIFDADRQVQRSAYLLLRERAEPKVEQALRKYRMENLLFERLEEYQGYSGLHVTTFANRQVENFNPQTGINDTVGTGYFLEVDSDEDDSDEDENNTVGTAYFLGVDQYEDKNSIINYLETLLQDARVDQVEALVFGVWHKAYDDSSKFLVDALVAAKDRLSNLKAVFIGDIPSDECDISSIQQSDISPVLEAYPNLEVLQVRGGDGLAFSPVRHNKLEALIVETGGLNRETIAQICALDLPVLEHLELWLGHDRYGGDSSIEDLNPILFEERFPHLTYLGLRNSHYSDDIAEAVVRSPLIARLLMLDLSMGTLTDEGAEILLNCPAINQLDILNVSENYLSGEIIVELEIEREQFNVELMAADQKYEEEGYRYCSVAE